MYNDYSFGESFPGLEHAVPDNRIGDAESWFYNGHIDCKADAMI